MNVLLVLLGAYAFVSSLALFFSGSSSPIKITNMSSPVKITTNGFFSVKRNPELGVVRLQIKASGPEPGPVLESVSKAAAEVSDVLRPLAVPKEEGQNVDVQTEVLDPAHPITSWKMQDLRTWSRDENDEHRPHPPPVAARVMMAAAPAPEGPRTTHYAQVGASATFHDFEEMSKIIAQITKIKHVEVSNLSWRVTKKTEAELQTRVTQGAYESALLTAKDLAEVISGNPPRPAEVDCHSSGGGPRMFAVAAEHYSGGNRQPEPISFEPEPIEISGNVRVVWNVDPK